MKQIFGVLIVMLFSSSMAWAQTSRTWVSGVGDDSNPCSRTAPCKTFMGALPKTADGGEIDVLDSGGYGSVTINKSITIDGTGTLAGILHNGVVGVVINAPASATVVLRNLSIDGVTTGTTGVRVLSAGRVFLDNVAIANDLAGQALGLEIAVAAPVSVSLSNCSITNTWGAGVFSNPSAGAQVKLSVDHCHLDRNATAIFLNATTTAAVMESSLSLNGAGVYIGDAASSAHIHASTVSENGIGLSVSGAVALWGSQVVGNDTAFHTEGGGQVSTHGNNAIIANGSLGATPVQVGLQ